MGTGIAGLDQAYHIFFMIILIMLAVLLMLCLVRAIIGPRIADRVVSVNMMGTMVIVIIAILALMLGEGYLADICIIYAMISFLAVIVLTKVCMGVYLEKKEAVGVKDGEAVTESRKEVGKEGRTGTGDKIAAGAEDRKTAEAGKEETAGAEDGEAEGTGTK